jgi:hypothetical protein
LALELARWLFALRLQGYGLKGDYEIGIYSSPFSPNSSFELRLNEPIAHH